MQRSVVMSMTPAESRVDITGPCVACGNGAVERDHLFPLLGSDGVFGLNVRENIIALCRACNQRKGNTSPLVHPCKKLRTLAIEALVHRRACAYSCELGKALCIKQPSKWQENIAKKIRARLDCISKFQRFICVAEDPAVQSLSASLVNENTVNSTSLLEDLYEVLLNISHYKGRARFVVTQRNIKQITSHLRSICTNDASHMRTDGCPKEKCRREFRRLGVKVCFKMAA